MLCRKASDARPRAVCSLYKMDLMMSDLLGSDDPLLMHRAQCAFAGPGVGPMAQGA